MYNLDYVEGILELEGIPRGTVQARGYGYGYGHGCGYPRIG